MPGAIAIPEIKGHLMQIGEIQRVRQRYRMRINTILTPDELWHYEQYQQRITRAIERGDIAAIPVSVEEQQVLDKIAADIEATAIDRQYLALIRVEKLPQ